MPPTVENNNGGLGLGVNQFALMCILPHGCFAGAECLGYNPTDMAVVIVEDIASPDQRGIACQDYPRYIKVVVDIERELLGIGGEWHADAEAELLRRGSKQKDLWGGGLDLVTNSVEFTSLINTRPGISNSQEVLDQEIRTKMEKIIRRAFGL